VINGAPFFTIPVRAASWALEVALQMASPHASHESSSARRRAS
jgi:hypothetical protein